MSTLPAHDSHDAHGHDHDHPWYLAHHWENPKQQFEAGKLGMWLFLATEVLLFGGLFCAYSVWRGNHPELFKYGSQFLETKWGAINTCVLILSSLTMAWGVTCAQKGQRTGLIVCLILTLMGAAGFMVIKYIEYSHKFHEGYFPGLKFYDTPPEHSSYWGTHDAHGSSDGHSLGAGTETSHAVGTAPAVEATHAAAAPTEPVAATAPAADPTMPVVELPQFAQAKIGPAGLSSNAELVEKPFELTERHHAALLPPLKDPNRPLNAHKFFDIYFMMTGLHGIHVLVGMIVITWLLIGAIKGKFSADYFTPVDLGGLYWHIVDLIWIFLFPLFYLI